MQCESELGHKANTISQLEQQLEGINHRSHNKRESRSVSVPRVNLHNSKITANQDGKAANPNYSQAIIL